MSESVYLFVLCPPYCGSTLLWKLLSTSAHVSALPDEGQFLPELESIMREKPWDASRALPWPQIKQVWDSYWDSSQPVLLEKSPPNLIRTREILAHFQPVKFVIMVRDPYAQVEGLMRRNRWKERFSAHFAIRCLRAQLDNARALDNALVLSYESLVANPAQACAQLAAFIPALGNLDPTASFEVHSIDGTVNRPITELNSKKIAALSPDSLAILNTVFEQHEDTLADWGYQIRR